MSIIRAISLVVLILAQPGLAAATSPFRVYFAPGSAELTNSAERTLKEVAHILLVVCPGSRLSVMGHDDTVLSPDESMELSKNRARSVAAHLRGLDVSADRMFLSARGHRDLAKATTAGVSEPLNRRVTLTIGDCED